MSFIQSIQYAVLLNEKGANAAAYKQDGKWSVIIHQGGKNRHLYSEHDVAKEIKSMEQR